MNRFNLRPNATNVLYVTGSYLYLRTAAGPVEVVFRDTRDQVITTEQLLPGQGVRGIRFDKIDVKNLHNTDSEIEIFTSNAQLIDNRLNGDFSVQIRQGAGIRNTAEQVSSSEKLILASDQFRLRVIVANVGENPALIGGGFDVAVTGLPLAVGEKMPIETAANSELWAYSQLGTDLKIWEEIDTFLQPFISPQTITTNSGAPVLTESGEPLDVE